MKSHEKLVLKGLLDATRDLADKENTKANAGLQEAEGLVKRAEEIYAGVNQRLANARKDIFVPSAVEMLALTQTALQPAIEAWNGLQAHYRKVVEKQALVYETKGYISAIPDKVATISQGQSEGARSLAVMVQGNADLDTALTGVKAEMVKLSAEVEKVAKLLAEALSEQERVVAEEIAKKHEAEAVEKPSFNEGQVFNIVQGLQKSKPLSGSETERANATADQIFAAINMLSKLSAEETAKPTKNDFPVIVRLIDQLLGPASSTGAQSERSEAIRVKFVTWLMGSHSIPQHREEVPSVGNSGASILHMHSQHVQTQPPLASVVPSSQSGLNVGADTSTKVATAPHAPNF